MNLNYYVKQNTKKICFGLLRVLLQDTRMHLTILRLDLVPVAFELVKSISNRSKFQTASGSRHPWWSGKVVVYGLFI